MGLATYYSRQVSFIEKHIFRALKRNVPPEITRNYESERTNIPTKAIDSTSSCGPIAAEFSS